MTKRDNAGIRFKLPREVTEKARLARTDHLSVTVTDKAFVVTASTLTPLQLINVIATLRSTASGLLDKLTEPCDCCVECGYCFEGEDDDTDYDECEEEDDVLDSIDEDVLFELLDRDICLRDLRGLLKSEVTIHV